ncbi:MAG: hypothetical protein ACSLFF_08000 [Solirubrobacterales bacterium]
MPAYEISRTLVKSQPEVWAEIEKVERLAELLGDDAISITRSEPESTIEWAGSSASGTIEIAASGWGTKVSLKTAVVEREPEPKPEPEAVVEPEPEPIAEIESTPSVTLGFWAKLKLKFAGPAPEPVAVVESEQEPEPEPEPVAEPEAVVEPEPIDYEARMSALLDHLGSAHKRPFVNG